ncbi:disease resistance protein TAO1-like [Syzygium oleosum]|uniref:disease resistance protein TAO1-like n=1 Tax=Syzygium oleosum TaxID=219896 RepID=UPI0024B99085|nr:disease resistance protein TAO1-like [Syzygium oleosum]
MELAFRPSPNPLRSPSPSPPLPFNLRPKRSRHGHPFRVRASSNPGPPFGLPSQHLSRSIRRGSHRFWLNFGVTVKKETGFNFGVSASNPSFISLIPTGEGSDQYDVFLSFNGSDTRKEFTDHLYHSLVNVGIVRIHVFRDENSISIGEEFGSKILDAISRSKISIPIISENYASRKWCLRELSRIMYCKKSMSHVVLPIFYKVAPSDVRHLDGKFGEAFHLHQKDFDEKDIEEGQRALKEVSYLNGWESKKIANGHEGELIKLVVETVLSELRKHFQLYVPKQLVGLDGHLKEIMNWIDSPSVNARMLGIYGMGGIGKTTLAKCIYNKLLKKFVHASFLPDIRETTRRHGIEYLQSQLISDILQSQNKVSKFDDGINIIKSRFKGKKVLIILDDIDKKDQLNALARERNWFTSGSIIIVTTRNKAVLDQSEFEVDNKYELNEIDENHSLLLFNRHAFRMDYPPREFEDISHNIISTMGGLPLALEVTGSYLYGKTDPKVWEDMLRKLKKEPHRDVEKILKISYDALENAHKEIFLDIACFLIGKESKFAIYMWEDCGFYASLGIEELKLRCLIKIDNYGELRMHDQLRDLGRNIIQEEGPPERRSRLWLYEEAFEVLMGEKAAKQLKILDITSCGRLRCTPDLSAFTKLEILILNGCHMLEQVHPSIGKLKNLVSLDLGRCSGLKELPGEVGELEELKELNLRHSRIAKIPMSIGSLRKLEKLTVCSSLREIPSSIGNLSSLQHLNLESCHSLIELPSSIGNLSSLQHLNLEGCASLIELPSSIGNLSSLQHLNLKGCVSLRELPSSIGILSSLQHLNLVGCESLRQLPSSIWNLSSLSHLDLEGLSLGELPSSIGNLSSLQRLVLEGCESLRELPSSIGNLSSLQHLNLKGCVSLRELPSSIGNLSSLQCLVLEGCESLRELPSSIGNLSSLQSLDLKGCVSLGGLPSSIGNLSSLQYLDLKDCWSLREIPSSIGNLFSLQHLELWCCRSLRDIPNSIGNLQDLQCLDISYSTIEHLPSGIGRLKNLRRLILNFCRNLRRKIPSEIGELSSLEILEITHAPIYNLPESVQNLSSLQQLNLWSCSNLRSLPEPPSGLTHLTVSCHSSRLPQLSHLIHLEELRLEECNLLENIPELPSRPLRLYVDSCHKLMPKLDGFKYLEVLSIVRCNSIERLDISQLNRLKRLHIECCDNLVEIQGHDNLECLETIVVRFCRSIQSLILQELKCLKLLKANFCGNLVEIQGLNRAKFLEVLDISNCGSIERLPHLSSFATLKTLKIDGCYNLRDVDNLH